STGVPYEGPALQPEHRYFWRVKVWNKDGKPYPASDISWWETGLLIQTNWQGKWIGYEYAELHKIRESGAVWFTNTADHPTEPNDTYHAFRYNFNLDTAVRNAALYVAGEDTPAAWINGQQVLQEEKLVPWLQMPWQTYTRVDVTKSLRTGANLLAVRVKKFPTPRPATGAPHSPNT